MQIKEEGKMKKIIFIAFLLVVVPLGVSFSQDIYGDFMQSPSVAPQDVYGDYMKSSSAEPQDNVYGDYILSSSTKVVSLDLEDAALVDILKMLSQQTGFNFVSTEAVESRSLTLYVEKVPLKEALDIMFKANNLAYDYYPESNMFVIKEMGKPTIELKAKVYRLQYVRVESTRLTTEINETMGEVEKAEEGEGRGIIRAVEQVLTEFGKVTQDPITNSVIVVDVPSQFPMIDEVVRALDIPMPQVMIEVEVLDVAKKEFDEIGVQWKNPLLSLDVTGARMTRFPFGGRGTSGHGGTMEATTPSGKWDIGPWPADQFAPTILTFIGQNLEFDLLHTLDDVKLLARPKILTLSNETAEIKLITDQAVSASRSQSAEGEDVQYSVDREEVGTILRVTPQVDIHTGDITLFVDITVSNTEISDFKINDELLQGEVLDPQERTAKSIARLKPGETLLMGGLILNERTKSHTKVPILGDIPFLGRFFRHDKIDNNERELLVFITPKVISPGIASVARLSTPHREQQYSYRSDTMRSALDKLSAY